MGNPLAAPPTPQEPVLRPVQVDMTNGGEQNVIPVGEPVHSIFVYRLGVGVTLFEIEIAGLFIPMDEGDTMFLGDCTPTLRGLRIRSTPALPNIFTTLIIGGTPDTRLERA